MTYQVTIAGRKGHMEDGDLVTDEVLACCEDDQGRKVWAGGATEAEAEAKARQVMDKLHDDDSKYREAAAAERAAALMAIQLDDTRREVKRLGGKA